MFKNFRARLFQRAVDELRANIRCYENSSLFKNNNKTK